jgi:predicted dehydrogenase
MLHRTAVFVVSLCTVAVGFAYSTAQDSPKELRTGIIGLDTSHSTAFTKLLNDTKSNDHVPGARVVAAYPKGSPDIASSVSRVPEYTKQVQAMGVEIVDSIDRLLGMVDAVLLETNDGRPHLDQVLPVIRAGKRVFVDKPIAGSLADVVAIFDAAKAAGVPLFSSSSLRFVEGAQALRAGKIGEVIGCDAYSPCSLEKTHPDLFWYGIHGVETLFTVMGPGCETVTRVSLPGTDFVAGTWKGGRVGTYRGIRQGTGGYGGTAYGTKGIAQIGSYGGYRPLLVEVVKFFQTGKPPVSAEETIEIYAFMEAADESKRQGGVPVSVARVVEKARAEAKGRENK